MPIHDWTRVDHGTFHDFHHGWATLIRSALNNGVLPPEYEAKVEQHTDDGIPDVLALRLTSPDSANGVDPPPVRLLVSRLSRLRHRRCRSRPSSSATRTCD